MTLQLELKPETERSLRLAAQARNIPVEEYALSLLESPSDPSIIPARIPRRRRKSCINGSETWLSSPTRSQTIRARRGPAKSSTMITTRPPSHSHCLVDTNILLRLIQSAEKYPAQHMAMQQLLAQQNRLYMTFQNVAEFWNVSTRPVTRNGRKSSRDAVLRDLRLLESQLEIVTEDRATYEQWLRPIVDSNVTGRQVHDARLVAHMLVHGIPYLLTSNIRDFLRYPQIQLLDPEDFT